MDPPKTPKRCSTCSLATVAGRTIAQTIDVKIL
jgi:hypothetical protein